jgi:hypothetical protein
VANDDVREDIIANPIRYTNESIGANYQEASYLTSESFHKERVKKNAGAWDYLGQLKLDFTLGKRNNMRLSLGGSYEYLKGKSWGLTSALFNNDNNPISTNATLRVNARLNHRVYTDTTGTGVLKNVMYDLNVNYTKFNSESYAARHKDRLFEYGYIGKFTTTRAEGWSDIQDMLTVMVDSVPNDLYAVRNSKECMTLLSLSKSIPISM